MTDVDVTENDEMEPFDDDEEPDEDDGEATELGEDRITLGDLLHFDSEDLWRVRLRLCSSPAADRNNDPMEAFKRDPDEVATGWTLWQFGAKRKTFQPGNIAVGLCRMKDDKDRWLLVTVKTITKSTGATDAVGYEGEEWAKFRKYYGRVIVRFHRTGRYLALKGDKLDQFEVERVLPDVFDDDHFPGYDNVTRTYVQLKRILDRHLDDWYNALSNQKGVYVITDLATGKLYVGSATAEKGMLLKRWTDYVNTLHGGDVELRALVKEKGGDYVRENFQYTLLENYNARESDDRILERESWWKNALASRAFGYNGN